MEGAGLLRKLQHLLPRSNLLTFYKSSVIYDQPLNATFSSKIELVQYDATLAITGAIRGSSLEKLF